MVRSRGKGKKQTTVARDDPASTGEEEKVPVRRRGRPLKTSKVENQVKEEVEKAVEEEDSENANGTLSDKDIKPQTEVEDGRKRSRYSQIKGDHDMVNEKSGVESKINSDDSIKPVGFRQNGSRRKNKPRRAAEVGVECK